MATEWLQRDKEISEWSQDEFINNLMNKTIDLVNNHGPIIDVVHNRNGEYLAVEEIINMLISYFYRSDKNEK